MIEIPQVSPSCTFPHPSNATKDGILAYGGDLSPTCLMRAYSEGIFPWFKEGEPILWWSPNPRLVMYVEAFKLRKSLKKRLNKFEIRINTAFSDVIAKCAKTPREGQNGTWITPHMQAAYIHLNQLGYAHSVEAYQDGKLVGGLYGVAVGAMFCGESMFTTVNDASKVAFAHLIEKLKSWGFEMIDAQVPTAHLLSLGACEIGREAFLLEVYRLRDLPVSEDAFKN